MLLTNLTLARAEIDRAARLRDDPAELTRVAADPTTRILPIANGRFPVLRGATAAVPDWSGPSSEVLTEDPVLLGVDETGEAFMAAFVDGPAGSDWVSLREVGAAFSDGDAGLVVSAVALANWHASHRFCPACGGATVIESAGWARTCLDEGRTLFPRTDPSIIVLVRDSADRALLGRKAEWPQGWFSTLAGFIEAGESAESALKREVFEEAGVQVSEMTYLGSQPWPFPASLMLGYHAWTTVDSEPVVDGVEIAEAIWVTREELLAKCADGTLRIPPPVSIARRLIERWYGAELPGEWSRP